MSKTSPYAYRRKQKSGFVQEEQVMPAEPLEHRSDLAKSQGRKQDKQIITQTFANHTHKKHIEFMQESNNWIL
jgi:hypothetical protein